MAESREEPGHPRATQEGDRNPSQAAKALEGSKDALAAILKTAVETDGKVKNFRPDVAGFFAYLVAHDAHHRGQIAMLAWQIGHTLPPRSNFRNVGMGIAREGLKPLTVQSLW